MDVLCACPASPSSDTPVPSLAAASSITAAATTTTTASDVPPSRARLEGGGSLSHVSEMAGCFICGLLTCVFAIVGLFIGAATGAFIGLSTESGLLRGAGIGAISGAIFSIDVAETSLTIWRSRGSGLCSILFLVDIIASLLSGRLVREKVGPAMQNAVRIQMSAVEAPSREAPDMFETGGTEGMPRASVERMARERITGENRVDSSGEKICCSVCLQDLQVGEIVRCLPHCRHKFHVHCIDAWLLRHGSCPLCRRDV